MMMMREGHNPTIQVPPWSFEEPYAMPVSGVSNSGELSPYALGEAALAALQRWLPSNEYVDSDDAGVDSPVDAYSSDEFRMYEFKVRRCARGRSHDWTECPFAHPGEKARRRDPRKYHYSGTACPDFRKGGCKRGDTCEFAHGVFECWLHPARYRTEPCKDGTACRRRVCFFAHTPEQLRVLPNSAHSPKGKPESYDGSPLRHQHHVDAYYPKSLFSSSPTSTLISPPTSPSSNSPPLSPSGAAVTALRRASMPFCTASVNEVLASMRQLQLSNVKSAPCSWGFQGVGSPRAGVSGLRAAGGFSSLPTTPTRTTALGCGSAGVSLDPWGEVAGEEHVVESGRALRAKMFERLAKEGGLGSVAEPVAVASVPDVGWVSELVK